MKKFLPVFSLALVFAASGLFTHQALAMQPDKGAMKEAAQCKCGPECKCAEMKEGMMKKDCKCGAECKCAEMKMQDDMKDQDGMKGNKHDGMKGEMKKSM